MIEKKLKDILDNRGEKLVVFTNGCFDILHRGHISYLNDAKAQGHILILGLNSDSSVRRLKGSDRPVNSENDRSFMLENLRSIDHVVIFEEDTPYKLIEEIQPDILVKGGDWAVSDIIGHDIVTARGGTVKSLRFENGYSTTNLINKMQGKA